MIPIYKPFITDKSIKFVNDAMRNGWIAQGEYIEKCENLLKEKLGVKYCLLTSSGTTAGSLAAKCINPYVTIIAPDNIYVAAWNVFVDEGFDLQITPNNFQTYNSNYPSTGSNYTRHFLVVHNLGNPVNVPELKRKFPNSIFIEDNCEGMWGKYEGEPTGSLSDISFCSFFGNKTVTCGEGGAFFTNSFSVYERAKLLYSQGCDKGEYISKSIGYNYRMSNLQAAFLYGQLLDLDLILKKKKNIFSLYKDNLSGVNHLYFQDTETNCEHSHWMFSVRVPNKAETLRESLLQHGIESRRMFPAIHKHKAYQALRASYDYLYDSVLMLPSFPGLTEKEVNFICDTIKTLS